MRGSIRGSITVTLSETERRLLFIALGEEAMRLRMDSTGKVMQSIESLSEGRVNNINSLMALREKINEV